MGKWLKEAGKERNDRFLETTKQLVDKQLRIKSESFPEFVVGELL